MKACSGATLSVSAVLAVSLMLGGCSGNRNPSELTGGGEVSGSFNLFKDEAEYPLLIGEAGIYRFDMRSEKFDSVLELSGQGVSLSDDDSGGSLDARITAFLEPGRYRLRAHTYSSAAAGSYTLSATHRAYPAGITPRNGGDLPLHGRIHGVYTGEPLVYQLNIPEDALAIIDMRSADFDGTLNISGEDVDEYDDDGGDGYNARLSIPLQRGCYDVVAGSNGDSSAGLFALKVRLFDIAPDDTTTLVPGTAVSGYLDEDEGGKNYDLRIDVAGRYVIDMVSSDLDSFLSIRGPGVADSNDDGGGSSTLNARLSLQLQPGTYRVRAKSYDESESGRYVLSVSEPGGGNASN